MPAGRPEIVPSSCHSSNSTAPAVGRGNHSRGIIFSRRQHHPEQRGEDRHGETKDRGIARSRVPGRRRSTGYASRGYWEAAASARAADSGGSASLRTTAAVPADQKHPTGHGQGAKMRASIRQRDLHHRQFTPHITVSRTSARRLRAGSMEESTLSDCRRTWNRADQSRPVRSVDKRPAAAGCGIAAELTYLCRQGTRSRARPDLEEPVASG